MSDGRSRGNIYVLSFVIRDIMKTTLLCLGLGIALAGAGSNRAAAFGTGDNAVRTTVTFVSPEKFTDASDRFNSDRERNDNLAELRVYLIQHVAPYLATGQKLTIAVTDVDLAGEFEPWCGPRFDDIRIVKDIYPPRIQLTFRLMDADGQVVKEGKRDLRDMTFLMKLSLNQDDPLRYEKTLLDDWLREEFRGLKKST